MHGGRLGAPPSVAIEKNVVGNKEPGIPIRRRKKMREYTTQMDAARKGIVTPEIKAVAEKEHMTSEALMKLVAEGKVAICANRNHTCLNPEGVGSMLHAKELM